MAIAIGNAPRGCGSMRDGCYLEGGEMSKDGTLLPLVWILGDMCLDSPKNLFWEIRPQTIYHIDGEQSLDTIQIVEYRVGQMLRAQGQYAGSGQRQLQQLQHTPGNSLCLLKHTGEQFYTPAKKAIELARRGPSERVEPDLAIALAPLLRVAPLKLFYSTKVPFFFNESERDRFMDYIWAEEPDEETIKLAQLWNMTSADNDLRWEPTWESTDWRWTVIRKPGQLPILPYNGSDHWWVRVLSYLHRHADLLFDGVTVHEAVFCGTHFTKALQVVSYEKAQEKTGKTDIDPSILNDEQFASQRALSAGIQVAILPPKGEESW